MGEDVLLVGYGNPARRDDGVGISIVEEMTRLGLPGVATQTVHQLNMELVEDIIRYKRSIFVDASQGGQPVSLRKCEPSDGAIAASSHHLSPNALAGLAERLYHVPVELYICTVRGENFDFGDTLTPGVQKRAMDAIGLIRSLIEEWTHHA